MQPSYVLAALQGAWRHCIKASSAICYNLTIKTEAYEQHSCCSLKAASTQEIDWAFFAGDNLNLNPPFLTNGNQVIRLFNPSTQNYSVIAEMDRGRWYPTIMSMADGNLLVLGGMQQVHCQQPASIMLEPSS